MHNTCIPLDLLYIDDDGLIVGIVENAPTLDDGSRERRLPFALRARGQRRLGARHGVKAGGFARFAR